MENSST
jgi:hypothetical protein